MVTLIEMDQSIARAKSLSINDTFSKDIVTVLVGPVEVEWKLHSNLLASRSDFFKSAFNENWKEGQEKTLRLPEDDPRAFELFVGASQLASPLDHLCLC